ncbi:hypothetical protein D1BOALGB6SA_2097, partial [Olavius sp. associated proteobacterium Delta 1]
EVRISAVARSADWIKTHYNNQQWPNKADWPDEGFITVTDALGSDIADFPVLVSIQDDPQLKTTASGGMVMNANGYDIIFTSDAAGTIPLSHEVESYDGTTGTLTAWVKLPVLKFDEDTEFYLYYGNSDISSSQENVAGVWDSNYVMVQHLEETDIDGGAGDIKDSTSPQYNAATSGMDGSDQVAGKVAGSFDFDGTSDYMTVPEAAGLDISAELTVEAWVNLANAAGDQKIVGKTGTLPYYGFVMGVEDNGLKPEFWDSSGTRYTFKSGTIPSDQWTHLVLSWKTDGSLTGYINGSSVDSIANGSNDLGTNDADLIIGAAPWIPDTLEADGKIDEIRISNTARPAAWIQTNYNNQRWPNKAQHPDEGFITVQRG